MKGVSFNYPSMPNLPVLNGINLSVKRGEVLAIVGHSGCGKSTIANLLLRYYDPMTGTVLLDGKPLKEYNVEWLRKTIGLVQQQPILLPGTIFENIALGLDGATLDDVKKVAALANAHDFIMCFPDQYDTDVGSIGTQLSGGQRQRIAIARTLIAAPPILILDEATSALDSRSEKKFQKLLEATRHECTTIVIAHRLSTVRSADRILVMDGGCVVEQGDHAELMKNPEGMYYKMIEEKTNLERSDSTEGTTTVPRPGNQND